MILYPSFFSSSSSISHKASHSFLVSSSIASAFNALKNSKQFIFCRNVGNGVVVLASKEAHNRPTLEIVFDPFEEVKKELPLVPIVPYASLARQKYTDHLFIGYTGVEAIKKISEYVAQLRRVGKGHEVVFLGEFAGVWHFDQMLPHDAQAA
ncbi:ferritin-3 [Quercus suber]|uniref:Ferritin-3 n=1 Tax=Quercus suber TaxID=58331 RepID=A0AAW0IPF0_QUESU